MNKVIINVTQEDIDACISSLDLRGAGITPIHHATVRAGLKLEGNIHDTPEKTRDWLWQWNFYIAENKNWNYKLKPPPPFWFERELSDEEYSGWLKDMISDDLKLHRLLDAIKWGGMD